ncbi:MAG: OmpA family protein, partial [Pseudomonadota bacterium]
EAEAQRAAAAKAEAERKAQVAAAAKRTAAEASLRCIQTMRSIAKAGPIRFRSASATLSRRSKGTIAKLAATATGCPNTLILIEGHTDASGPEDLNKRLANERAATVRRALVAAGVSADQLRAEGFGEEKPIANNRTPEGRALNRRIEFSIPEQ